MPARADRRGPRSSGGRAAHEAFPAGSQEEGSGAALRAGAHAWASPWADLTSADPVTPPGSGISASREAPGVALVARLRPQAQDAAGFDPKHESPDGPEHAPAGDPKHAPAGDPKHASADGPELAPADARNRAG